MENNYSHLVVPFIEFKSQLETKISEGNALLLENVKEETQFHILANSHKEWKESIREYLRSSFAEPFNDFLESFDEAREQTFHFNNLKAPVKSLATRTEDIRKDIKLKIQAISHNLRIVANCDQIIGDTTAIEARKKYTTQQKIEFILRKLYELNDDSKYPIEILLAGNGFIIKNYNEPREIAKALENRGYIDTLSGMGSHTYASITIEGALYVEQGLNGKNNSKAQNPVIDANFTKIFIVHGHDHGMKETVARAVQNLGFTPVILHEMPNQGRTVIEKFTDHSEEVQYAIVLLSADDFAYPKNTDAVNSKLRPRQNVVFELGYFIGKLGRNRVFPLYETLDNFEIHSDFAGVVLVPFDTKGAWKMDLARELKALGVNVDWNALMN